MDGSTYHWWTTVSGHLALGGGYDRGDLFVHTKITSNSPLGTANALGGLVELGGHVEVLDGWLAAIHTVEHNERVDLEVGEVEVHVDAVESRQEVDQGILLLGRNMDQERVCNGLS